MWRTAAKSPTQISPERTHATPGAPQRPPGRRLSRRAVAGLAAAAAAAAVLLSGLLDPIETNIGLRALYGLRGPVTPPDRAVIVALNRDGIERLQAAAEAASPPPGLAACLDDATRARLNLARSIGDLPRALHACGHRALKSARVVAYDIHFAERGDAEAVGDASFAREIAGGPPTWLIEHVEWRDDLGAAVRHLPSGPLRAVAAGVGFFVVERRAGPVHRYVTEIRSHPDAVPLAAALARAVGSDPPSTSIQPWAPFALGLLHFHGPPGAVSSVSFAALMLGDPGAAAAVEGRVVIVGAADPSGRDALDVFETPYPGGSGRRHAGVELIATAFLNIVEGDELRRPSPPVEAGLAAALVFAIIRLVLGAGGLTGAALATGAGASIAVGMHVAFAAGVWLPFAWIAGGLAPALAFGCLIRGFLRLRSAVAVTMPRRLIAEGLDLDPLRASRSTPATVLFLDVAGSTGLAEVSGEAAFGATMTRMFAAAETAIEAEGGDVIKFTGDGLLAIFSPLDRDISSGVHANRACAAAGALAASLRALGDDMSLPGVRIGIESGEIALGYVGGDRRGAFDALGDAVNVAARLQEYGKIIAPDAAFVALIGGATRDLMGSDAPPLENLGEHVLRGRAKRVAIHRIFT